MFKNFIKTTFRNLAKHKGLAIIHLAGLSVSIAAGMLIFMWVNYQFSFDKSLKNHADIYRVYPHIQINGNNFTSSMAPPPLRSFLTNNFPEVEATTRIYKYNNSIVGRDENGRPSQSFHEELYQADSAFFRVFNFKMLQGNPLEALVKPNCIVITKSTAIKYFGEEAFNAGAVPGQSLNINMGGWKMVCKITGITEDVPANAHFHYTILLSDATDSWYGSQVWVDNTYYTYVLLKKGTDYNRFENKIPAAVRSHIDPFLQTNFGIAYDKLKAKGDYWEYKLQPVTDIHLHSNFERELEPGENIDNVYILLIAAFFLVLMACINYANLSTANSIRRSKEIGVRKTLGSSKLKLVALIFTETGITCFIAWLMAFILIIILLRPFESLMHTALPAAAITNAASCTVFFGLFFIISLLGGIYPAFYLSSFNAVKAVKGKITPGKRFITFKSALIVAQFFMFIGLIVCTLMVKQQLNFLHDKYPGFNKENVLVLKDAGAQLSAANKSATFISELKKKANVLSASICTDYPNSGNDNFPIAANFKTGEPDHMVANISVGYDFLKTFNIKLLQGRDFDRQSGDDSVKRVVLNEAAVKELGIENPVGNFINTRYLNSLDIQNVRCEIIGVTDDFNFKSLHKTVQPMAIFLRNWGQYVVIRIAPGNVSHTINIIKKTWSDFVPGAPFNSYFLDEQIDNLYKTEAVLSNVLDILTALIILIAVMGLTGLTLLTIQQRTKEIGIRKVTGASVSDILFLFSKEYIKWVGFSFILTAPVAYFIMQKWLQGFAYRIHIQWWVFLLSAIAALMITMITVGFQAIKAATANPVKSLRTE
ncbi:ABC transporter permease [Parafilimonas sp.]|uniref:ABC transporter permease n=1 Tax=Parafilimonas sp. TaxID=1969739 RepID=UPI0039E6182E